MISQINTVVFSGVNAQLVEIQTHLSNGLPCFNIVGLANKSVSESKERIKAAFSHLNIQIPPKRITINLSPSSLIKEGSHFDLPIALSLLISLGYIKQEKITNYIAIGELSLNGDIRPIKGTLAALIACIKNKQHLIFPNKQLSEVGMFAERLKLIPAKNITELIDHFNGKVPINAPNVVPTKQPKETDYFDMADIKGQETAKRALEIAAAGEHNILFIGPPGVGKSTLAYAMKGILPPLTKKEMLHVSVIHSIAGLLGPNNLITNRPFRAPHHSISDVALIGGGKQISPGEITLASNGVLFLDELAEFRRNSLDSLRQPIETRKILISRANEKIAMPCKFQLIAATNPCSCGYFTVNNKECKKAPFCAINYQSKISGPLLDRIDLIIELSPPEEYSTLNNISYKQPSSKEILAKVVKARSIQNERYKNKLFNTNAYIDKPTTDNIVAKLKQNQDAWNIFTKFVEKFKISVRSYNKIIKIAQTISDLEGSNTITKSNISEAIFYRKTNCTNGYLNNFH